MIDRQIFRDVLNYNHIMQDVIWFKPTNKSREWKDGGGNLVPIRSAPAYVTVYSEY
jgi:hypothetical protein